MANGVDEKVGVLVEVDLDAVESLKSIVELKARIAQLKKQQEELKVETMEDAIEYEKLNSEIKKSTAQMRGHEKQLAKVTKEQKHNENSVAAMRQKVIDLKKVWAELDQSSSEFADATKELAEMTEKLKEAEASVGVYSRNVGNYGSAMEGLGDVMQGVLPIGNQYIQIIQQVQATSVAAGGGTKGMAAAFKGATSAIGGAIKASLAFIATPLGATLAAIALAGKALFDGFNSTAERIEQVEELSRKMTEAEAAQRAAQVAANRAAERNVESVKYWKEELSEVGATWKGFGILFRYGVKELIKYSREWETLKATQNDIIKEEYRLYDKQQEIRINTSILDSKIREVRRKSEESERSITEQIQFQEEALKLLAERASAQIELTEEQLALQIKINAQDGTSREDKEKEIDLEVKLNELKSARDTEAKEVEAKLKTLVAQRTADEAAAAKEEAAAAKKAYEIAKKRREEEQKLAEERKKEATDLAKSTNDYYNDLRNNVTDMLTKTVSEQLDSVEKKYSDAIASMKKIEAPDPMGFATPEEYEQALDDYDEFRANQIVYTRRLEQQKAEEIEAINKSSLAKQIKAIEDSANDKYAADLIAFRNNEAEKLRVQEKILVETIAQKKAAGLDTYNEEAQLEALRVSLIESGLAQDLMSADRNAKERYDLKKAAYEEELALAEGNFDLTQEINEKIAQADRDLTEERIENASKYLNTASQLASSLSEIFSAQTEAAIESADEEFEGKQAALEEQHEAGLISDEEYNEQTLALEEEHNAEIAELERQQALRDRAMSIFQIGIDTAQGIMKAVVASPWTGGMPWAAIVAAMGAVQIATVLSQPLPKAATGGLIVGNSHANGGVAIEAEGGEVIINKKSASMFPTLLSEINEAGGGAAFASGNISDGGYALRRCARDSDSDEIVRAIKEMNLFVSVEEFNKKAERVKVVESRGTF